MSQGKLDPNYAQWGFQVPAEKRIEVTKEFTTANCSEFSDFFYGKQLGKGAYAIVYEGTYKPTGERVAIKQYDKSKLGNS